MKASVIERYCAATHEALRCTFEMRTSSIVPLKYSPVLLARPMFSAWVFPISAESVLSGQVGIYLYGFQKASLDFHGGKLCLKAPFTRLFPVKTAITGGGFPCPGVINRNFNNAIQSGNDPMLTTGQTVNVQVRMRDVNDPAGFGDSLTDAVSFVIGS